jgi:hypothetical protein
MVDCMKAPLPKQRSLNPAILLLWLGLAAWGALAMMSYSARPGPTEAAPGKWPAASRLPCPSKTPVLIMFVHPNDPWSKASIGELSSLMTHCQSRVDAYVLFLKAAGQPAKAVQSVLWRQAAAIAGVRTLADENGREARFFRAQTSGEVVFYGANGRLGFQGGITLSGGRVGDNPGRRALQALINRQTPEVTQTPVFGNPLFGGNLTAGK